MLKISKAAFYKLQDLVCPNMLFNGDDKLFKEEVIMHHVYGEYGCGKSTKWILQNSTTEVISVDTSKYWVQKVLNQNKKNIDRLNIHYSNVGETTKWGYPKGYSNYINFNDYTDYIWKQKKPSIVLIDGRFRVCCFLTSLKFAEEGTKIFFDDYTDRYHYHFIEKYVSIEKKCGRQCLFIVPSKNKIDINELNKDISLFRNVMD